MTDLAAKVAFLRRPESYPGNVTAVESIETHMAWVFLAGRRAYKMKKPARGPSFDFSTLEARHRDCSEEVRLNRRLAPDVYLTVLPLTSTAAGLRLGGDGDPVEWLVVMKRLPREAMLDRTIEEGRADEARVLPAAEYLADFFHRQPAEPLDGRAYIERLRHESVQNGRAILAHAPQASSVVEEIVSTLGRFLDESARLLTERVLRGRVIEGHGDLRPEHIFLGSPPAVIDCLEFERRFRILDPVQELAFLGLECEHLGAPGIGALFMRVYGHAAQDRHPARLVSFYAAHCGLLRAKIAVWHLADDHPDPERWIRKCRSYLESAVRHARASLEHEHRR